MPTPPRIIHLDELEALPGPDTLTWLPVRATLGIRAFGCNAYRAAEAGHDVVEPHSEAPSDHEELYFVARGHATFTIDGQSYDAPAGTYVFVPDPASQRHAVAAEAGTTVLSFGGPPSFAPSAWEWVFRAAGHRKLGDLTRAGAEIEEGLALHPESGGMYYELACLEATSGNAEEALAALARAIELDGRRAAWAADDEDFASLRDDPRFSELVG
jgi:quercetin dioxygenase-like cupin family protein